MGTISERKQKDGTIRYRAEIRINKDGTKFSESKTFSSKTLAKNWLKKREAEIETDPTLLQKTAKKSMTFGELATLYVDSAGEQFASSWQYTARMLAKMPIGALQVEKMTVSDFNDFATARRSGAYDGYDPVGTSTLQNNMMAIRVILSYGESLGLAVPFDNFDKSMRGLTRTRQVTPSNKRDRLPTTDELIKLTQYFKGKYDRRAVGIPMHFVMWFAIYTARRQDEITRLQFSDFDGEWWYLRDVKDPKGSKGNHKTFLVNDNAKRLIPLFANPTLRQNQRTLLHEYDDDLLLPASSKSVSRFFTHSCKVLGIDDLHFHDLRHEACTRFAENGLTVPQIQQHSLHENWANLQRYVNIRPRQQVIEYWDICG